MHPVPPVLLIAFNRPEPCAAVFAALRGVRPRELFFAVDGPRADHLGDAAACRATRDLVRLADWECTVHTLFHERNKGCRTAPPAAITWFFEHVPQGIILEDDCVPSSDFFPFVGEMLARYAQDQRVGMVSGNNHYGFQTDRHHSYHFSQHASIWGWATWARAWRQYDGEMTRYRNQLTDIRASLGHSERFRSYWWRHVTAVQAGMNTWDIQWAVALLAHRQWVVRPRVNLVANIGFAAGSTHTGYDCDADAYAHTAPLTFPLAHPATVVCDVPADRRMERRILSFRRRGLTALGSRGGLAGRQLATALRRLFW